MKIFFALLICLSTVASANNLSVSDKKAVAIPLQQLKLEAKEILGLLTLTQITLRNFSSPTLIENLCEKAQQIKVHTSSFRQIWQAEENKILLLQIMSQKQIDVTHVFLEMASSPKFEDAVCGASKVSVLELNARMANLDYLSLSVLLNLTSIDAENEADLLKN